MVLKNLIINGEDNLPPNNSEVSNISLDIAIDQLSTQVCAPLITTEIEFSQVKDTFTVNQFVQFPVDCSNNDNQIFQNLYFITFFEAQTSPRVFEYEVEVVTNDTKRLTLTNEEGNLAIFGDQPLSTEDFSKNNFAVFPNPAKENLVINSKNTIENLNLKIFSTEGRLIRTQNLDFYKHASIDVSNLSNGIYFLNIEDERGRVEVKKFIKE